MVQTHQHDQFHQALAGHQNTYCELYRLAWIDSRPTIHKLTDSLHTRPFNLAPPDALRNLAKNANKVTAIT